MGEKEMDNMVPSDMTEGQYDGREPTKELL